MHGFEWDPNKELENVRKHGIDFTTATRIWAGSFVEKVDDRRDYAEIRIIATSEANGRLLVVVFTWRADRRRIISARRANSREKRRFEAQINRENRPSAH